MKPRQPPAPPSPDGLTDAEAAALYRASVPAGWRFDGPEWAFCQHAVVQLLARRWRRRVAWEQEHGRTPRFSPTG